MKKYILLLVLSGLLFGNAHAQHPTTFVLVRHAEKDTTDIDPNLTQKGKERARFIGQLLQNQPIAAVMTTPFIRTRETARLIAEPHGLAVEEYNPLKAKVLFEWQKEYNGKVVVVVGHSNTVPTYINLLTESQRFSQLDDQDYDKLFFVTVYEDGEAKVLELNTAPFDN